MLAKEKAMLDVGVMRFCLRISTVLLCTSKEELFTIDIGFDDLSTLLLPISLL